jgi:hypothetical protein
MLGFTTSFVVERCVLVVHLTTCYDACIFIIHHSMMFSWDWNTLFSVHFGMTEYTLVVGWGRVSLWTCLQRSQSVLSMVIIIRKSMTFLRLLYLWIFTDISWFTGLSWSTMRVDQVISVKRWKFLIASSILQSMSLLCIKCLVHVKFNCFYSPVTYTSQSSLYFKN